MEQMIDQFKKGHLKLNPISSDKLLDNQLKQSSEFAQQSLGQHYDFADKNHQAVFDVLAMSTENDPKEFEQAIGKIAQGDWQGIKEHLTGVPKDRRDAAVSYMRSMAHSPMSFRSLIKR